MLAGAPNPEIGLLILAVVSPIPYLRLIFDSNIIEYHLIGRAQKYAHEEVVDATKIDCLVGRVATAIGTSYIVERDTVVGDADEDDETANEADDN